MIDKENKFELKYETFSINIYPNYLFITSKCLFWKLKFTKKQYMK